MHFLLWGPKRAWKRIFRKRRVTSEDSLFDSLRRALRLLFSKGALPETRSWKGSLVEAHVRLGFAYHPQPAVPVKIHLFRDLAWRHYRDHLGYVRYDKPDFGWQQWAGIKPTLTWHDGRHDNIMKGDSAPELARLIETELDAAG
jgi:thioesterase domain-containing protein